MDIDATVHMAEPKKRLTFDPTINLGHILTAVAFLSSGFVAYNNLDKRLTVQEQLAVSIATQRQERDADQKERLAEIKADIKDLARLMADLTRQQNIASATKGNK